MWPFRKRWRPKPGDHVRVEFVQGDVPMYEGSSWTTSKTYVRSGVVTEATKNGKQIRVHYTESYFPKGERWVWLETRQAMPTNVLDAEVRQPSLDARVLAVVAELQQAVGGVDPLIDLLWSVGSAYGVTKREGG